MINGETHQNLIRILKFSDIVHTYTHKSIVLLCVKGADFERLARRYARFESVLECIERMGMAYAMGYSQW